MAWRLALALMLVAAGCGLQSSEVSTDNDPDSTTPGQPVTPPSTSFVLDGDPINIYDVDPGDCFNEFSFVDNGRAVNVVVREPCNQPHQREVYHYAEHPAPFGVPFPGDQEMRAYATGLCYEAFEPFVGQLYELSELDIGTIIPTQLNFEDRNARYRGIHCYVERTDGEELTGTVAGSAR